MFRKSIGLSTVLLLASLTRGFRTIHHQRIQTCKPLGIALDDGNVISILAGSVAGALGVGAGYPFDTIGANKLAKMHSKKSNMGMFQTIKTVLDEEGLKGLYSGKYFIFSIYVLLTHFDLGVIGVMAGQSLIKSVAFFSNHFALNLFGSFRANDATSTEVLIVAALFSGFVVSFIHCPIERIKLLMQTDEANSYSSEIECITSVIKNDGFHSLFRKGLLATLIRDVPGNVYV